MDTAGLFYAIGNYAINDLRNGNYAINDIEAIT